MTISMGEKRKNVLKWLVEFKYKDFHWALNVRGNYCGRDFFGKEIRLKILKNVIRMERARSSNGVKCWALICSFPITKIYIEKVLENV